MSASIAAAEPAAIRPPARWELRPGSRTWPATLSGVSTSSNVAIQFLHGPGISGFALPPVVSVSSVEDYGPAQPPLPFCAASYPATLDAGTLIATVPGRGPAPLQPQNRNGLIGYQAAASVGAIQAGEYSISTAAGAAGLWAARIGPALRASRRSRPRPRAGSDKTASKPIKQSLS